MNELLNVSFYRARRRRHRILVKSLKRFVQARGLRQAQPLFFFFLWKLLAGIRGNLTDGFLRESIVIQQRCVHVRMCARAARKWAQITARRSVETPKTTNAFLFLSLYVSFPITRQGGRWLLDAD